MIQRTARIVALLLGTIAGVAQAQPAPPPASAPPSSSAQPASAPPSSSAQPASDANAPSSSSAQASRLPCVTVPVDLALWTSISINARYAPSCARNYLGIALVAGKAGELRGLQLGLLGQTVERSSRGIQLGGLLVATGRDGVGLQVAGLIAAAGKSFVGSQLSAVAATGEHFTGLQLGVLGAAAGDNARGIQLGGLFAASGQAMRGIQLGGLFAATGEAMRGIQGGGLFAASGRAMHGLQVGGLFAATGNELRGLQLGGLFVATGDEMRGLQLGGLFSAAGKLAGLQVSAGASMAEGGIGAQIAGGLARAPNDLTGVQLAIVNIGGAVHGAQIGLVNIADTVDGAQIGLVNVADRADAPIGLVSWMRNGPRAIEVAASDALPLSAALRLGSSHVYSLVGVAADPVHDVHTWGPVAGVGIRAPVGPLDLLVDTAWTTQFFDGFDHAVIAQLRARLALPVSTNLDLIAGLTANGFASSDTDGADLPLALDAQHRDGATTYRLWPGFVVGLAAH